MDTLQRARIAEDAYTAARAEADRLLERVTEAERVKDSAAASASRLAFSVALLLAAMQADPEADPARVAVVRGAAIHNASRATINAWSSDSDTARAVQANAARFIAGGRLSDSDTAAGVAATLVSFAVSADPRGYDPEALHDARMALANRETAGEER